MANEAQKETMKNFNIDDMEDLYDDMADMMADMEEVQEVMGRNYNADFDENELMDELNELDEEIVADQINGGAVSNPSYIPQQANSSSVV